MSPEPEGARVERFINEVSTRFTLLPVEDIAAEVGRALRLLVEVLDTDRATLFEFSPDATTLRAASSWSRPGIEPYTTKVVQAQLPWYHAQLVAGRTVRLERLPDDLPDSAVEEREYTRRLGMQSILTIPIMVGQQPICALATAPFRKTHRWPDPVVERVRLVGQILANALYRQRVETELRDAVTDLERTREELVVRLEEIRQLKDRLEEENRFLRTEMQHQAGFPGIVGRSLALRDVLAKVARVAPTDSAVLLLGETGTGKDVLAHAIHDLSPRRKGPHIKIACSALPPNLIESELFGHEKGAFTGATESRAGRFELADGGTLFLDEIGELAVELQVKLLRVLQDGKFERVGSTRSRTADVRIVAATNRDLERAMREGRFREDLYYRLSVFPIHVPPLRERREDIPLLVWSCINRRQSSLGRHIKQVPKRAMEALMAYGWPGNVRELENVIERALILTTGSTLQLEQVQDRTGSAALAPDAERLDGVQRAHIQRVLDACSWRIEGRDHAAHRLGLSPSTLRSQMRKLGITRPARPAAPGPSLGGTPAPPQPADTNPTTLIRRPQRTPAR